MTRNQKALQRIHEATRRSMRYAPKNRDGTHFLKNSMYCICGQDAVTCQLCGSPVCGEEALWVVLPGFYRDGSVRKGNVCPKCI